MVPVLSLWLPVLLSGVGVFTVSSIIHMVLRYHRNDYGPVPSEDDVRSALRSAGIPPGDYMIPHAGGTGGMNDPDWIEKATEGPVALLTVAPSGVGGMGKSLAQWFAYTILVGVFAGYVAGIALAPGAEYMEVFRFVGTVAFAGYSLGALPVSIWYHRSWAATLRLVFDGLLYAVVTAGIFGSLWPS